jgi:hypothetical protein
MYHPFIFSINMLININKQFVICHFQKWNAIDISYQWKKKCFLIILLRCCSLDKISSTDKKFHALNWALDILMNYDNFYRLLNCRKFTNQSNVCNPAQREKKWWKKIGFERQQTEAYIFLKAKKYFTKFTTEISLRTEFLHEHKKN